MAVWLSLACAMLASPGAAGAQTPGNAPRNPYGRDITLTVPLHEFGPLGQVEIKLTKDNRLQVSSKDLLAALEQTVTSQALARLGALAGPDGFISSSAMAKAGFPVSFDSANVDLAIHIPNDSRASSSVDLGRGLQAASVLPDHSATAAVFMNYRLGEAYNINTAGPNNTEFLGDLELGGRVAQSISFDNFATLDQNAGNMLTRTASRVFYDMPGSALRFTLGDLVTQTYAFQNDPQISGFNVSHLDTDFGSYFSAFAAPSQSLVLTRPSTVQILVNNLPVNQLQLGPGTFDLRNLPFVPGSNDVKAVITDDSGQRRVVDYSYFSDIDLLAAGESEYTGSIGILAPLGVDGPAYDVNRPAFSGYYRRGLSQQFTLGGNLQADKDDQMFGFSGILGTAWGLFSLDLSGSHRDNGGGTGEAAQLQYRLTQDSDTLAQSRTIDFSAQYRSANFLPVTPTGMTTGITEPRELVLALNITQPLARSLNLELSGSYTKSRLPGQDEGSASAFVTWDSPYDFTVGLGASYQWAPQSIPGQMMARGFTLAITFSHSFGDWGAVDASADRFQQHIDYSRPAIQQVDDYFINAYADHGLTGAFGNATAGYETDRGTVEGVYTTNLDTHGTVEGHQIAGFFDGSVAYADGKVGLGQRVDDSFALVDGDPSLGDRSVIVESHLASNPVARSGTLGPAVVPLTSYFQQTVPYDVQDLPPGYDLGTGNFELYPWYHSGYALTVGSPYNITVLGHMLDAQGKPLALRTGTAVSTTDRAAPKREVITNQAGRFAALGLSAGTWHVTMTGDLQYEIVVPKSDKMLVTLGTLKPLTPTGGATP